MIVHDFTMRYWGHALHMTTMFEERIEPSRWRRLLGDKARTVQYLKCLGHGPYIAEGDELLVAMESGRTARFRVIDIEWVGNPHDMFKLNRADFIDYAPEAREAA